MKTPARLLAGLFALSALPTATAAQPASDNNQTAASRALETLRQNYATRYGAALRVVVIDPDRLDALPSWLDARTRYNTLFSTSGLTLTDHQARQLDLSLTMQSSDGPYSYVNRELAHVDLPEGGLDHQLRAPFTIPGLTFPQHGVQRYCLVLPAEASFNLLQIPGLGREGSIRFINRHEFRHCAEDAPPPPAPARNILQGRGLPLHLYQYSVDIIRVETRADLGAVSDMIVYDGANLDVIGHVARWRQEHLKNPQGHDINHYSGFALLALQREITAMGVDAWRALDDAARDAAIIRITDAERLTNRGLRDYLLAVRGDTRRLPAADMDTQLGGARGEARERLNAARHLAAYQGASGAGTHPPDDMILDEGQRQEIARWNAVAELTTAATTGGRALGIDTLAQARAQSLDRLRAAIDANPADIMGGARIIKLDQAYRHILTTRLAPNAPAPAPATRAPRR